MNRIAIVIGSWGSYNECNERALGSKWLTLNDYSDWNEIEEELEMEGFQLNGIDEELFVQDIENFVVAGAVDWDCVHPQDLFELLQKSGILDDDEKFQKAVIYCDIEGYYFLHEVECVEIPECLENYIDYKSYGEQFGYGGFYEYDGSIAEIRR